MTDRRCLAIVIGKCLNPRKEFLALLIEQYGQCWERLGVITSGFSRLGDTERLAKGRSYSAKLCTRPDGSLFFIYIYR